LKKNGPRYFFVFSVPPCSNASAVTASAAQQTEQPKYSHEQHEDSVVSSKGKSRGSLEKRFAVGGLVTSNHHHRFDNWWRPKDASSPVIVHSVWGAVRTLPPSGEASRKGKGSEEPGVCCTRTIQPARMLFPLYAVGKLLYAARNMQNATSMTAWGLYRTQWVPPSLPPHR
jgi:hypothetical protein